MWLVRTLGIVAGTVALCALMAAQPVPTINPHTNIAWPPGCELYNAATNACVHPGGTAANPAGTPGQLQFNAGTFMGASPSSMDVNGNMQASVNTRINVRIYGAKGDCTSDDHDAIIAAQSAALATPGGATLEFPKAPGGCYLTSKLEWQGVPIEGQPGGTEGLVVIKSKPGQDILHVADPALVSYQYIKSWSIRNLQLTLDTSVGGTFPHRWPGRWFDDGAMTTGSAVFKTITGNITCADIGQAIKVFGAGPGGTDLITTVADVAPCWATTTSVFQIVTLAAAASTTVTNAHTYLSLLNLPVTTNIGACAIAWDNFDGDPSHWNNPAATGNYANFYDVMNHVTIASTAPTGNNCAIYTQGVWGFYGLDVRNFEVRGQVFGVVQGSSELGAYFQSSSNDFQKWDHGSIEHVKYPWIEYNGGYNSWSDIELTAEFGFQLINLGNRWFDGLASGYINISEFEGGTGAIGMRFEGTNMHIVNTGLTGGASQKAYLYTFSSMCDGCYMIGTLQAGGAGNHIKFSANHIAPTDITDGGLNNAFTNSYASNPFAGIQPNYNINITKKKGQNNEINRMTADFIRDGNYSTPYSLNDLLIWPKDLLLPGGTPGMYEANIQADASSPTGSNIVVRTAHALSQYIQMFTYDPNAFIAIGSAVPAAPATIAFYAKCPAGTTTFTLGVGAMNGGYGYNQFFNKVFSCTTAYQTYSTIVDFTPYPGGDIFFVSTNNTFYVAWIAIRPNVGDVNGVSIASITPLVGTTGSIGGSALTAGQCTSGTVAVASSTTAMAVVATPVTYPGDAIGWRGYVSAAGTVTVKICATIAGTPTASNYNVRVIP
ncbi:MAG TPA: hypothetical protein VGH83_01160 [Candidatus Acidoferrum sp.]